MQAYNVDPPQQQSGNIFVWIDELEASLPRMTRWMLALVGSIVGFCYAGSHQTEGGYTVICVTVGFFIGLLFIQFVAFALKMLVMLIIVAVIGLLAYWLYGYQFNHQQHPPSPASSTVAHRPIV